MDFTQLLESLKGFITGILFRWIMKIGGTWLATIGLESGKVEELIGGIVMVLIGLVVSLIQQKKAVFTPPPTP